MTIPTVRMICFALIEHCDKRCGTSTIADRYGNRIDISVEIATALLSLAMTFSLCQRCTGEDVDALAKFDDADDDHGDTDDGGIDDENDHLIGL